MGPSEGTRLLLVTREAGIPDAVSASNRWSIDHLLLDQYGVPTLVEVKRSSDTRIRREVVGQLLEYAANMDAHWPSDRIRSLAVEQHGGTDGLDEAVADLLALDPDADVATAIEAYWSQVEENLKDGKLRLLFVADELPREVRRIIEFLNEQMTDVEVLGVELRQYVADNLRAMVPRVIGQTEATRRAKSPTGAAQPRTSLAPMLEACPTEVRPFIQNLIDQATRRGATLNWGTKGFSVRAPDADGGLQSVFYCYPPGTNGSDSALVMGYLDRGVRGTPLAQRLEREYLAIEGVTKGGKFTFNLPLTGETLLQAERALAVAWVAADELEERKP